MKKETHRYPSRQTHTDDLDRQEDKKINKNRTFKIIERPADKQEHNLER